jgi:hypothetical protein
LLSAFNPTLLDRGVLQAFVDLKEIILVANNEELETLVSEHLLSKVPLLVQSCMQMNHAEHALVILQRLTERDLDLSVITSMFNAGFVNTVAVAYLTTLNAPFRLRYLLWDVLSNLAISCDAAQQDILESPLVNMHGNCSQSPFFQELMRIFTQCPDEERFEIGLQIMYTVSAFLHGNGKKIPVTPLFCFGIWPYLLKFAQDLQPIRPQDMTPKTKKMVEQVYLCIDTLIRFQQKHDITNDTEKTLEMIVAGEITPLLQRMMHMYRLNVASWNKSFIRIMQALSGIPLGEGYIQKRLTASGWFHIVVQSCHSHDAEVRALSLQTLGNYMSDGVPYVEQCLPQDNTTLNVLETLQLLLRTERNEMVIKPAIFAFMTMFKVSHLTYQQAMGERGEYAQRLMRTIVKDRNMFRYILPLITRPGCDLRIIKDVLIVLCDALEWDAELVQSVIHDLGDAVVTELLDRVNHSKGLCHDTELFDLACRADDLLNNKMIEEDGDYFAGTNFFQQQAPAEFAF